MHWHENHEYQYHKNACPTATLFPNSKMLELVGGTKSAELLVWSIIKQSVLYNQVVVPLGKHIEIIITAFNLTNNYQVMKVSLGGSLGHKVYF